MNNEFNDIINSLKTLEVVLPDPSFRKRMKQTVSPNRTPIHSLLPLSAMRCSLMLLAVIFIGSGCIFIAAASSKPGEFLYPVKQVFTNTTFHFTSKPAQKAVGSKSVPTLIPTRTPIPTTAPLSPTEDTQNQSLLNNAAETAVTATQIPIPSVINAPTSAVTTQTHDSSSVNANAQINNTPVNVNLSVGASPPSGNGDSSTGSKDSSGAEDTTSLLPAVKINLGL